MFREWLLVSVIVDFFSGIGGFRLGLERLNGNCVLSCEISPEAAEAYREVFGDKPAESIVNVTNSERK